MEDKEILVRVITGKFKKDCAKRFESIDNCNSLYNTLDQNLMNVDKVRVKDYKYRECKLPCKSHLSSFIEGVSFGLLPNTDALIWGVGDFNLGVLHINHNKMKHMCENYVINSILKHGKYGKHGK